jgi:hypothetical protein
MQFAPQKLVLLLVAFNAIHRGIFCSLLSSRMLNYVFNLLPIVKVSINAPLVRHYRSMITRKAMCALFLKVNNRQYARAGHS